ncbi:MAG TPA: ABC transporter ATP-binding protein [Myxococcales bacterium]|jgi:ABC-type multidrug transport system ATPase subunit
MESPLTGTQAGPSVQELEPAVELAGVTKTFGPLVAVNAVSLRVERGAVYGLIGPNGAGKTTTFSMVCGYLKPDSGTARVLGHRAGDLGSLKGRLGALPQDAMLPGNDLVGDALVFYGRLLGMPKATALKAAQEGLERVGLSQWWRVRCGALSHGMAKRVGLAQAFLGSPEVVLLDEPTAGLDPKSAFHLREFIRDQRKSGHTIVISSHNLTELEELCDAAAILDHGKVVAQGSMAELTRSIGEVRIALASDAPPIDELRALPCVATAEFDAGRRVLAITYAPGKDEAEAVIGEVLKLLLARGAKISSVSKGRKLEERVMELT